ncbi:TonB-dependent receptor [Vreelandella utahensis]|uniref:TonB-dependent receptor n=1 Tax=Vreelandella halophila TaxID=86177 RepID=UPI0015C30D2C|nr:TonB-dependent receptor [Halomonas utahensis]
MTARAALVFLAAPMMATAQAATLTGKVVEPDTQAPVSGATVTVQGADTEAITDGGGNYELEVDPGTYTLEVEAGSDYETRTVDGVEVTDDQPATRAIELARGGTETAEFGDYEVQAGYLEGSPASVITTQREAPQVSDVIGSDQMEAAGDSEAIGALKRVTGLSVEDGKFVTIRGQPERYTETTLNGSPLPSPDPIREIAPLDLFPTSILSSVSVSKSYDASQPGSFGAGLVDLRTLAEPDETYFEISVSAGGNTQSTGEDGLTYDGGDRDFLGTDDGTREISGGLSGLDGSSGFKPGLEEGAQNMPNIWAAKDKTLPPDLGLSIAGGTNTEALGADVGINGTLGWDREYRQRETTENRYAVAEDGLRLTQQQLEERTDHNIDLSGFLAVSLDWGDHKLTSNTFLSRKTTERAELRTGERSVSESLEIENVTLDWNERQMFGEQLVGEHDFDVVKLDWRALVARAERDNPDRRFYSRTRALNSGNDFRLTDRDDATRSFIDTQDDITSLAFDLERSVFDSGSLSIDLSGGGAVDSQDRESSTRTLGLRPDPNAVDTSDPIEEILAPGNIGNGVEVGDNSNQTDFYEGTADVQAAYLKADFGWADTLRVVAGLRGESADYEVESLKTTDDPVVAGFEESNLLPSLSGTWFFADDMQARVALGKTISRPTLNEIGGDPNGTGVRYRDPDTNEQFTGNPGLKPAEIESLDVRWEWFPSPGELVSAGIFAKDYTNALEEELIPSTTGTIRRVSNAKEATVLGFEATGRLNLPTLIGTYDDSWSWTEQMYLQGNFSLIDSEVTVDGDTRRLQGQADELVNLLVGYETGAHDLALAANFTGERLASVSRQQPDIFEEARTQIDIEYDYRWSDSISISAGVGNLLNESITETQGGRTYETYEPGVDFDVGMKYRF